MATRKAEHSLPAIATDVSLPMDVAREEIFEPVAAIIDLDTEDKASRFTTIRNTVCSTLTKSQFPKKRPRLTASMKAVSNWKAPGAESVSTCKSNPAAWEVSCKSRDWHSVNCGPHGRDKYG